MPGGGQDKLCRDTMIFNGYLDLQDARHGYTNCVDPPDDKMKKFPKRSGATPNECYAKPANLVLSDAAFYRKSSVYDHPTPQR